MSSCEPPWQAHDDRNLARKLTAAEKKEKKTRKLVGAADEGEAPGVSVFRVRSLARPEHKFKVRVNAEVCYLSWDGLYDSPSCKCKPTKGN